MTDTSPDNVHADVATEASGKGAAVSESSSTSNIPELDAILEDLTHGRTVIPVSVRTFLSWFGAQRRGSFIVDWINFELIQRRIETVPDFESVWIDSEIGFELRADIENDVPTSGTAEEPDVQGDEQDAFAAWTRKDATFRISRLKAADQPVVSISPDGTLAHAATLMMAGGYSQLPVMTNERDVKGMLTWRSIGSFLALGREVRSARDAMEPHHEIRSDFSIFDAIPIIVANDYVLVRQVGRISGIITASDLSLQFRDLTEPFLLLSEIENLIRNMIGGRFSTTELEAARDSVDGSRAVETVADLTFGEYIRLLQKPERWSQLGIRIDRVIFCEKLDRIRLIRNEVMHFDPDPLRSDDLKALRDFAAFLKQLEALAPEPQHSSRI